jgi:hypothetical protein
MSIDAPVSGVAQINVASTNALRFNTNNVERLRITSAGAVGIGNTAPTRALDIARSGATIGIVNTDAGGGTISVDAPVSSVAQIDVAGANALRINTNGTERIRFTSDGSINALNATSGNAAVNTAWVFRLAANGTAIGPTIADFFGAASSISLEASSVYDIEAYLVFTKTTAGTATWTMTASSAPTRMVGTYIGSPLTGIGSGNPQWGSAGSQAATTAPFVVTGTLTTAVNHMFQLKMQVQTNLATNFRLQLTQGAGTATPLAGSYYRVTKVAATTGTYVA